MAEKRRDSDGRILPENVIQRKDGSYMWKKSIKGKQYCEYARTLGEIKEKRNKALGAIQSGTYKGKHEKMREDREQAEKDITVNEWFFRWEKEYRVGRLKESTVQNNHRYYMTYFSDNIGRMKIREIKQIDVVKVLNEMHDNGMKQSSIISGNKVLVMMFNTAIENGLMELNPAQNALKVPRDRKTEKRILTEQEEERFFKYISTHKWFKRYVPLFTVGFGTGMRIGEILALTWQDIDFENDIIHVTKTLYHFSDVLYGGGKQKCVINTPKTENSIRDIPMLPKVKEAFLEQKKIQTKCVVTIDGYTDFVFTTRTGNVYTDFDINSRLRTIAAGINREEEEAAKAENREPIYFERFSPHSMRHTFTTRCYEKGVRIKVIQKILGHKKPDITLDIYTHTTESMIQEDMDKLK